MRKERKLALISLILVAAILIYCWLNIFTVSIIPEWRHYVALALFIPLIYLFFVNVRMFVLGLGLYLLIATFNGLALEGPISTSWLKIGPIQTPPVQMFSLCVFILYFFLNMNTLIEIYLDYEEKKKAKVTQQTGS